jgi:hypothetical protein
MNDADELKNLGGSGMMEQQQTTQAEGGSMSESTKSELTKRDKLTGGTILAVIAVVIVVGLSSRGSTPDVSDARLERALNQVEDTLDRVAPELDRFCRAHPTDDYCRLNGYPLKSGQ